VEKVAEKEERSCVRLGCFVLAGGALFVVGRDRAEHADPRRHRHYLDGRHRWRPQHPRLRQLMAGTLDPTAAAVPGGDTPQCSAVFDVPGAAWLAGGQART
jgi:hypothetical protein